MRSKAPLALMEQAIMVLVFALAAALCLRAFAMSDQISRQDQARDEAILRAESAAEVLKELHGDFSRTADTLGGTWSDGRWSLSYDQNWQESHDQAVYVLQAVSQDSGTPLLGQALVEVLQGKDVLFQLTICWQEVTEDG